jgi:peptide/nickel transport system ATP-binding protein
VATIAEVRQPEPVSGTGGLIVEGLTTELSRRGRSFKIVDGVSFRISPGEIVGLVGETGCGKTMTALSLLQLLPQSVKVAAGSVRLDGVELLGLAPADLRRLRGDRISMVFQDPMASLDPAFTIGHQIVETVRAHRSMGAHEARRLAVDMLGHTGIPNPSQRFDSYPHQFSGGMRQRVMLAMALVLQPSLLIADEPTTALDVTIQAQILELIARLSQQLAMSVLLITHNLGVVNEIADRAMVMYAGEIVEACPARQIFEQPMHPYTQGLLRSMPRASSRGKPLDVIPGRVPDLTQLPKACRFAARCPNRVDICDEEHPTLTTHDQHELRCFNPTSFR